MKKTIKILGITFLLSLFFLLLFSLETETIKSFDNYVYSLIQTINTPFTTMLAKIITTLASPEFALFIIVLCIIFIENKNIKKMIIGNAVVVTLVNQIIKRIVERPRPDASLMIVEEAGFSFPSAHTMFSLTFYGLFIYYINKSDLGKRWKTFLNILLVFLIITISFTRIYLGVHYASDVVAGLCISGIMLIIYSFFKEKA